MPQVARFGASRPSCSSVALMPSYVRRSASSLWGFLRPKNLAERGDPDTRGDPLAAGESSRTNADDRLSFAPLGRIEGCDGIVECRDVADVRPQPLLANRTRSRRR